MTKYLSLPSSIYVSIASDASFPVRILPKGMVIVPSPIQTLLPCLFKSSLSINTSFMLVLLYLILSSYNWPSSIIRTLNFHHIYFFHNLFTLYSFNTTKLPQCMFFTQYPTPHFAPFAQIPMSHFSYMFQQHTLSLLRPILRPSLIHTALLAG